ncbi:predicted protein [Naegleria gruberi]|uniref:Predicted protein n=1 Tax=Naegleria gruberi TaxID=5762 RepID=D2VBB0_NAEGR|nr:uncharacterized protein NAEGRDRAFT_66152 [Naegleria gruberi]EFC45764.1 predicted protein [Naegleria gruberi]|eukprot:XP_002678508.1 predicted protein [Naegleria gruberi strain NEG-M]
MQQHVASAPRIVMGIFTVFAGVLYGHTGFDVFINGYKSKNWKQTIGTVVQEEGETYNPYDPNKLIVPTIQYNADQKVLDPDTNQQVTIHRQFINRNYSYSFFGLSRKDVKELKLTDHLIPNTKVKLFYDPQDPKESVVVPGMSYGTLQTSALGIGCILSGLTFGLAKEDILSWSGLRKNKLAGGIFGFSMLLMLSSFSIPVFVKRQVFEGTEEERKARWIDPYIVKAEETSSNK